MATDTGQTHPEWPPYSHTDLAPGPLTGPGTGTDPGCGLGTDLDTGCGPYTDPNPDTCLGLDLYPDPGLQ